MASTWDISFQRIEGAQPGAAELLRLCAYLAPDDIPLSVLRTTEVELPEGLAEALKDEIGWDRVLGSLRVYSLVQQQEDGLRVHRLVQWVVRESLGTEQRKQWLATAIRLLIGVLPIEVWDPKQWPLGARLLPHAHAAIGLLEDQQLEPEAMVLLLDRLGSYLQRRAYYALARPLFERALAIGERALGPEHSDTARALNGMAWLLRDQRQLVAARALPERALAIREKVLGPDHPDTAHSLGSLGVLLVDQGELTAARPLHERALAIREKVLGPDHPDTARSLNHLAWLLRKQGELGVARPLVDGAFLLAQSRR